MKFDGAVVISGGFDPIHIGHLRMIQDAAKLGTKLIVIANCDRFLMDKKGYAFMPIEVRVVSEEDYQLWLEEAKIKFAKDDIFKNNKLIASNK